MAIYKLIPLFLSKINGEDNKTLPIHQLIGNRWWKTHALMNTEEGKFDKWDRNYIEENWSLDPLIQQVYGWEDK